MTRIDPPFGDQTFGDHEQWVRHAKRWLTCHVSYNNTEHGINGWRGEHFAPLCFDSVGRRCRNGGDFQRARDEGTFPVWWIWPDQIVPALLAAAGRLTGGAENGVDGLIAGAGEIARLTREAVAQSAALNGTLQQIAARWPAGSGGDADV